MESKLEIRTYTVSTSGLLIEPVWNRNSVGWLIQSVTCSLLIEPVWNRNRDFGTTIISLSVLLIEPVWNRNERLLKRSVYLSVPFNRTSMESKLSSGCGLSFICLAFNRTSMESKQTQTYKHDGSRLHF